MRLLKKGGFSNRYSNNYNNTNNFNNSNNSNNSYITNPKTIKYISNSLTSMRNRRIKFNKYLKSIPMQTIALIIMICIFIIICIYYSIINKTSTVYAQELFITEIMKRNNPKPWNAKKTYIWNGPTKCRPKKRLCKITIH